MKWLSFKKKMCLCIHSFLTLHKKNRAVVGLVLRNVMRLSFACVDANETRYSLMLRINLRLHLSSSLKNAENGLTNNSSAVFDKFFDVVTKLAVKMPLDERDLSKTMPSCKQKLVLHISTWDQTAFIAPV